MSDAARVFMSHEEFPQTRGDLIALLDAYAAEQMAALRTALARHRQFVERYLSILETWERQGRANPESLASVRALLADEVTRPRGEAMSDAARAAAENLYHRLTMSTGPSQDEKIMAEAFEAFAAEQTAALRAALAADHACLEDHSPDGCAVCALLADSEGQRTAKLWRVLTELENAVTFMRTTYNGPTTTTSPLLLDVVEIVFEKLAAVERSRRP